jgi:membrane-bound lytic murein transglycosylase MltF
MLKLTNQRPGFKKAVDTILILLFSTGVLFLISIKYIAHAEFQGYEPLQAEYTEPLYPDPVYFDFGEIVKRGTIRVITQYAYSTYFLYEGIDRGFVYEFVSRFAKEHGLKVEVVLTHSVENAVMMLLRGEGDLIAINDMIASDSVQNVALSQPYDMFDRDLEKRHALFQYGAKAHVVKQSDTDYSGRDRKFWIMRENAPLLKKKTDAFIEKHFRYRESDGRILRSAYLNLLRRRYFEDDKWISRFRNPSYDTVYSGYLSPYDEMIRKIADEAGVDWKLVVAVMAQESAFNPDAESRAGALGLMQIIPRFSVVKNKDLLFDPETNIREGVRYLRKHLNSHAHLDSLNRYSMALATYNVGSGNLSDAKKLAIELGNDPEEWNNVAEALLKLMHPEYYENARFGYKRGTETVNYVEDVLNRYSRYHAVYNWAGHFYDQIQEELMLSSLVLSYGTNASHTSQ